MSELLASNSKNFKWGVWGALISILAGFLAYFFVPSDAVYLKMASLALAFVCAIAIFFVSPTGKSFVLYAKEAYRESKKVVWPTRREVLQMTGVVFVFVFVVALFLFGVDKIIGWIFYDLLLNRLGGKV